MIASDCKINLIFIGNVIATFLNGSGIKFEDFQEAHHMFLKFSREIAAGMAYLSGKSFVHRDLAARNVLLNKYLTCKVCNMIKSKLLTLMCFPRNQFDSYFLDYTKVYTKEMTSL